MGGRKLSQYLNTLNSWMEKILFCKFMSFLKFCAFVSTHLFFTIFAKGLV